jgi:hypothetical protein
MLHKCVTLLSNASDISHFNVCNYICGIKVYHITPKGSEDWTYKVWSIVMIMSSLMCSNVTPKNELLSNMFVLN